MLNTLAVITGKLAAKAIRLSGSGLGSNLPGRVGQKLSPGLLGELASQAKLGVLAVSGTNGKSTTCGFVSAILNKAGYRLAHNRQGANLVSGITASLIDSAGWNGQLNVDYCLFEIDEAALPLVAKQTPISTIAVTNLFRDQLDRFGELDTTAALINKGIAVNRSWAVLNADDPNVAQLAADAERIYYGIESVKVAAEANGNGSLVPGQKDGDCADAGLQELAYCAKCGGEYSYDQCFYGQLGHYVCRACGHGRPAPQVAAGQVQVNSGGSRFVLSYGDLQLDIEIALPGMFNVYNALAAAALCLNRGVDGQSVQEGLRGYSTLFGRSERVQFGDKQALIQLIKNPAGASQAVQAAANDPQARLLIAINDNYADGRDVSWLWDAEFELLREHPQEIYVSGSRCHDMALRLKYAGIKPERIVVEGDLEHALSSALAATSTGQMLWVLPTYTCLLELQKISRSLGCTLSGT